MHTPKPEKKRILVVEDEEDERNLMRLVLNEYDVSQASSFAEGLRMAKHRHFHLYVLDNRMPDGTGADLCRRLREFDPHTPVILCSGLTTERDRAEALSAGAQAYLAKPIEINEVLKTAAELLLASSQWIFEARQAEFTAIREEFALRYWENLKSVALAAERRQRAEQRLLRLKAKEAFLNAKGSRGDFANLWPAVYEEAALRRN